MACKKAKVNENMDCFSLTKGQGKVREFLTFGWVATLSKNIYLVWANDAREMYGIGPLYNIAQS